MIISGFGDVARGDPQQFRDPGVIRVVQPLISRCSSDAFSTATLGYAIIVRPEAHLASKVWRKKRVKLLRVRAT